MFPFVMLTAVAVAGLLMAEYADWRPGQWLAKPLASTGFVAAAIAAGAPASTYGILVLSGLALCWLGDVLLIPRESERVFLVGIASFLFGHVAFAVAFAMRGLDPAWIVVSLVAMTVAGAATMRWLDPHIGGSMRYPVRAYLLVISVMVVCAAASVGAAGMPAVLVGALAFALSDVSVARDRFIAADPINRLWGLPLYYAAQLVIASTVGA